MPSKSHGMTRSPEYYCWINMRRRCDWPKNKMYHRYGGRGIQVSERWLKFENFLEDMGQKPTGSTLERINNNKNYGPENCKWASRKEQARNRRSNRLVDWEGKMIPLSEFMERLDIPRTAFRYGMDVRNISPQQIAYQFLKSV